MREVDPEVSWRMLHPRPVVLVGAGDIDGEYSFAPASWVTPVSDGPPVVAIALSEESCTRGLLLERGEFTLRVLSVDQVDEILYLSSVSGRDVDKLSVVGWRAARAREVSAPALDNALGVVECRVHQTVQVGRDDPRTGRCGRGRGGGGDVQRQARGT